MKRRWLIHKFACLGFILAQAAIAASEPLSTATRPDIAIQATITLSERQLPELIAGRMQISNWHTLEPTERCFILPYNDPSYGDDRGAKNRLELLGSSSRNMFFEGGETLVRANPPAIADLLPAPFLLRLQVPKSFSPGDTLTVEFSSKLPMQPGETAEDLFFEGWYPQPLARCPEAAKDDLDPAYFRSGIAAAIKATIAFPQPWQLAGPLAADSEHGIAQFAETATNIAFVLGKNYRHSTVAFGATPVHVFYHSQSFRDVLPTFASTLSTQQSLFGDFPFSQLAVVETAELQKLGLPGLIAVNRPRQSLFSQAQGDWLNWLHWMIANATASQWYGGAIQPETLDDKWLLDGIIDFATLEALSVLNPRFDLFNPVKGGYRLLSFDYLQMTNITAATLRRTSPFATLTTTSYQTLLPRHRQSPYLFIKQAIAMRQMRAASGTSDFYGFLRELTTRHKYSSLSPRQFHDFFAHLPVPAAPAVRHSLTKYLDAWWIDEGWPDFSLVSFDKTPLAKNKWLSHVAANQEGEIDFPPTFSVKGDSGQVAYARGTKNKDSGDSTWRASMTTDFEPRVAFVDPEKEAFDSNRFNNSSRWPGVNFFPGSANTLNDDAYTVLWVPYPFRRPGEAFSVGLRGGLFRYTQSGSVFKLEYAPSSHETAFELLQRFHWSKYALQTDLTLNQTYDNDRQVEAAFIRGPVFGGEPQLNLGLRLRQKQRMGKAATQHGTYVFSLTLKPAVVPPNCNYNFYSEIEQAPEQLATDFSYQRSLASLLGTCNYGGFLDLGMRLFSGGVSTHGIVPDSALFKPTELAEGRLRLDQSGLNRVHRLNTINTDLMMPFLAPLSAKSLLLVRKVRWRLFYDYGRAPIEDHHYRAAGLGFILPFGGDLSGAGSLTLFQPTIMAIVYQSIDGQVIRKPSIVFDVSGEF